MVRGGCPNLNGCLDRKVVGNFGHSQERYLQVRMIVERSWASRIQGTLLSYDNPQQQSRQAQK